MRDKHQVEAANENVSSLILEESEGAFQNSSDPKERDFIFRLLTEELKDRHERGKLEGWTPWLALGALLTMAWLFIQDLWSHQLQWESTRAAFVISSLGIFSFIDLRGTLRTMSSSQGKKRLFSLLHTTTTVQQGASITLWYAILAISIILQPKLSSSYALSAFGYIFGFLTIGCLVIIIIVAARLPVPIPPTKLRTSLIQTFIILPLAIFAVKAIALSPSITFAHIADIRAGAMLSISAFGIILISRGHGGSSSVKETLVELRQDIALGQISTDDARQRARVALQGMFLSDLVQADVRNLLKFDLPPKAGTLTMRVSGG